MRPPPAVEAGKDTAIYIREGLHREVPRNSSTHRTQRRVQLRVAPSCFREGPQSIGHVLRIVGRRVVVGQPYSGVRERREHFVGIGHVELREGPERVADFLRLELGRLQDDLTTDGLEQHRLRVLGRRERPRRI